MQCARNLGVTILLNRRVVSYNPDEPSITLGDEQVVEGDLVVAADGKSIFTSIKVDTDTKGLIIGQDSNRLPGRMSPEDPGPSRSLRDMLSTEQR